MPPPKPPKPPAPPSAPTAAQPVVTGIAAYIARLAAGETVQFRESGNSMVPLIASRSLCTYEPVTPDTALRVGDAVFCKVHGSYFTHLIHAIDAARDVFTIGNNHGHINGTCSRAQLFGRVTHVNGKPWRGSRGRT